MGETMTNCYFCHTPVFYGVAFIRNNSLKFPSQFDLRELSIGDIGKIMEENIAAVKDGEGAHEDCLRQALKVF